LDGDLNAAIDAVRNFAEYNPRPGRSFYVVSQSENREHPGFQVSAYLGRELELCDGRTTVAEIAQCLAEEFSLPLQSTDIDFCQALFEKARSEQLIAIYRPVSAPPRSSSKTTPPPNTAKSPRSHNASPHAACDADHRIRADGETGGIVPRAFRRVA
jgi:hypothetical protein